MSDKVQVRLTPDQLCELDALARAYGLSRSSLIRLLIRQAADAAGFLGGTTTPPRKINDQ